MAKDHAHVAMIMITGTNVQLLHSLIHTNLSSLQSIINLVESPSGKKPANPTT